jgi:hypothetical protein
MSDRDRNLRLQGGTSSPITPSIARLQAEVFARFPGTTNAGVFNCRKIAGSKTWSQHAWGNALDIKVPNLATGDAVFGWLQINKSRLGLGRILWRVKDHFDHLHVEGLETGGGEPPCAGGSVSIPGWYGVEVPAGSEVGERIKAGGGFIGLLSGRSWKEIAASLAQGSLGVALILVGLVLVLRDTATGAIGKLIPRG